MKSFPPYLTLIPSLTGNHYEHTFLMNSAKTFIYTYICGHINIFNKEHTHKWNCCKTFFKLNNQS